jgi:hypothetical protein
MTDEPDDDLIRLTRQGHAPVLTAARHEEE